MKYKRVSCLLSSVTLLFTAIAVIPLVSCGGTGGGAGGGYEIENIYGQDLAVQFTVKVSKKRISTAEDLSLVLESRASEEWSVVFPEISSSLGDFKVTEWSREIRRLDRNGYLVSTRQYTLEPFLPGAYIIPALTLSFGERGGGYPFSLVSEDISIEVETVLPTQLGEQDIVEISGPGRITAKWLPRIGLGMALLAGLGVVLLYLKRRRDSAGSGIEGPTSWEIAWKELEGLLSAKLIESGMHREFYGALSDIVRRYVESRFSIRAPELTTEEFLQHVRASEELSPYKGLLQEFLYHCDLVKFARHSPSREEYDRTVDACRKFLNETRPAQDAKSALDAKPAQDAKSARDKGPVASNPSENSEQREEAGP